MVEKGKELCEDLLANVREQYEQFKNRPPRGFGGSGGYGERPNNNSSYYGGGANNNQAGYGSSAQGPGVGGAGPSASPPAGAPTPSAADYAAQYSQYYGSGGADPYAAYGGYAAYVSTDQVMRMVDKANSFADMSSTTNNTMLLLRHINRALGHRERHLRLRPRPRAIRHHLRRRLRVLHLHHRRPRDPPAWAAAIAR